MDSVSIAILSVFIGIRRYKPEFRLPHVTDNVL